MDEGGAGRGRRADRALRRVHRRGRARRSPSCDTLPGLYVVKTDGLAAGKGVLVTESLAEAEDDVRAKLSGRGLRRRRPPRRDRGGSERPRGLAAAPSATAPRPCRWRRPRTSSGSATATPGPNTGGMGACSPVPAVDDADGERSWPRRSSSPTLPRCASAGIDYRGVLYAGLMLTPDGPEGARVQRPLRRPRGPGRAAPGHGDLADLLASAAAGAWRQEPTFADDAAVTVVCAAPGLPGRAARATSSRARRRRRRARREVFCAGVATERGPSSPPAAGCWTSPQSGRRSRSPALGPTRPSPRSTGP